MASIRYYMRGLLPLPAGVRLSFVWRLSMYALVILLWPKITRFYFLEEIAACISNSICATSAPRKTEKANLTKVGLVLLSCVVNDIKLCYLYHQREMFTPARVDVRQRPAYVHSFRHVTARMQERLDFAVCLPHQIPNSIIYPVLYIPCIYYKSIV